MAAEASGRARRLVPLGAVRAVPPGVGFMLLSAAGFSVMSLLVKVASSQVPAMEIVFARSVLMVAIVALPVRDVARLRGVDRRTLLARGVLGATALSLLYWGLAHMPLGDATTIHYTAPVWTALSAAWLLGEALRPAVLASVAASLVGVVLVARPTVGSGAGDVAPLAVGAVLAAAVLSGLAYTLVRKLRATDEPATIIFYLSWVGAVGAAPFVLAGGWRWPTPRLWAVLAGIGAATYVGQWALTHGLRRLEAGTATALGYLQIVLAFVWGALFLGEHPDASRLAGAGLVVASVTLLARRTATPRRARAAGPRSRRRGGGAG